MNFLGLAGAGAKSTALADRRLADDLADDRVLAGISTAFRSFAFALTSPMHQLRWDVPATALLRVLVVRVLFSRDLATEAALRHGRANRAFGHLVCIDGRAIFQFED